MFKSSSVVEQLAAYISEQIKQKRWTDVLPGRMALAKELNVNPSTLERAMGVLERDGVLVSQGAGKRRRIAKSKLESNSKLRVLIVLYDRDDEVSHNILTLQHRLHAAGHEVIIASSTLMALKHDVKRVCAMVKSHHVGACILMSASKSILEGVSAILPTFALFGAMANLPIAGAGPDKIPAMRDAIRWLHAQGKERIVMLSREEQLRGNMRPLEAAFLDELKSLDLLRGSYNLPIWRNSPDGFNECLDGYFKLTPPDAIFIDEITLFHIIQNYLAFKEGTAHRNVIRICMEYHPVFEWCQPSVPYLQWDSSKIVQRIVRWVNNTARGKEDAKQTRYRSKFVTAGE